MLNKLSNMVSWIVKFTCRFLKELILERTSAYVFKNQFMDWFNLPEHGGPPFQSFSRRNLTLKSARLTIACFFERWQKTCVCLSVNGCLAFVVCCWVCLLVCARVCCSVVCVFVSFVLLF